MTMKDSINAFWVRTEKEIKYKNRLQIDQN